MTQRLPPAKQDRRAVEGLPGAGIGMVLPRLSTNILSGLMEALAGPPYNGTADLPELAATLQMEADELFPIVETLQLLRFADTADGDVALTERGYHFVDSTVDGRKRLFAAQLLAYVPLAARIRQVLDERPKHQAPFTRFSEELEDHMPTELAEVTMRAVDFMGAVCRVIQLR